MRILPIILAICFLPLSGQAAVSLRLSSNNISQDQTVDLIMEMKGRRRINRAPELPLPEGLRLLSPQISHNSSIVNGRVSSTVRAVYTLQAEKTGTYTIGPFDLEWEGKKVTIGPETLHVSAGVQHVFSEISSSSTNVLTQQSFELTLTVMSTKQIANVELTSLDKNSLDLGSFRERQVSDRVVNGARMNTRSFVAQVKALSAGWIELAPTLNVTLNDGRQSRRLSPFGMINSGRQTKQATTPAPLRILVQAPPEKGKPESFAGALGEFRLEVSANPVELMVGDPITLRMQIYGKGNMKSVLPPSVSASDDFQVYEAKLIEERLNEDGTGGYKTLEQVIIPLHEQVTEIPSLRFSYFDPTRMKYRELDKGPIALNVSPGEQQQAPLVGQMTSEQEAGPAASILGEDLVYLKPAAHETTPPIPAGNMMGLSLTPALLWLLTGIIREQRIKSNRDPAKQRLANAPRNLRKHLSRLKELESDPDAFREELWAALQNTFADRFNFTPGEVTYANIESRVGDHVSGDLMQETRDWFDRMDQARYGIVRTDKTCTEDFEAFEAFARAWVKERVQ